MNMEASKEREGVGVVELGGERSGGCQGCVWFEEQFRETDPANPKGLTAGWRGAVPSPKGGSRRVAKKNGLGQSYQ